MNFGLRFQIIADFSRKADISNRSALLPDGNNRISRCGTSNLIGLNHLTACTVTNLGKLTPQRKLHLIPVAKLMAQRKSHQYAQAAVKSLPAPINLLNRLVPNDYGVGVGEGMAVLITALLPSVNCARHVAP